MKLTFTRVRFLLIALFYITCVKAQQDAHYSQFMFNKLVLNPAFAGNGDKFCATLLGRTQWTGFGGGTESAGAVSINRGAAPQDLVGSFSAPLGQHIGVGIHILKDDIGFSTYTTPTLSLAGKFNLGSDGIFSAGLSAGIIQESVDGTKFKAIDPNDPKIPPSLVNGNSLDVGLGLYYQKAQLGRLDNFYVGASASHINQPKITMTWAGGGQTIDNIAMHYYMMAGAEYVLNSTMTLQPNILLKKDQAKLQADLNCYVIWNQNIRAGLTWRPVDAVVLLFGYQFPKNIFVGYSYDLTTSKILKYSAGSHEIVLRYCFGVKTTVRVPVITPRLTPRFM